MWPKGKWASGYRPSIGRESYACRTALWTGRQKARFKMMLCPVRWCLRSHLFKRSEGTREERRNPKGGAVDVCKSAIIIQRVRTKRLRLRLRRTSRKQRRTSWRSPCILGFVEGQFKRSPTTSIRSMSNEGKCCTCGKEGKGSRSRNLRKGLMYIRDF